MTHAQPNAHVGDGAIVGHENCQSVRPTSAIKTEISPVLWTALGLAGASTLI
jgi:hypothetical protein